MEKGRRYIRRPKRKLCYQTNTEDAAKEEWRDKLSMESVDRMFNNLDSPIDVLQSSVPLLDSDGEKIMVMGGATPVDAKAKPLMSSKEDQLHPVTGVLSPILNIGPVTTSSPLEDIPGGSLAQTETNYKVKMLSPIPFDCEDGKGAAMIRLASDNPTTSNKNPPMPASSKSVQQPSVSTVDKDHEGVQRNSAKESMPSPSVKKDIWAFLKKVQNGSQDKTKPKTLTPVNVPMPSPEFGEDFQIMDDVCLHFSIPTKSTSKQNKNKESSSDKGSLIDRGSKNSWQETDLPSKKLPQLQTDQKKTKNKREKKTKKQHPNSPNKKNPQTKRKKADDQPNVVAVSQTDDQRVKPSSEVKTSSTAKRENPKSSRPAANVKLKKAWRLESSSSEECDDAGLASPLDVHPGKLDPAQGSAGGTFEQTRRTILSWSSPEECQVLGTRKRKPPGEWWLSCPQNLEQPEVRDEAPRIKKPKANRREPTKAESASPAKADKTLKSKTKKDVKKGTLKKKRTLRKISASELNQDRAEQMRDQDQLEFPGLESPLEFDRQNHNIKHKPFPQVYHQKAKKKRPSKPLPSTPTGSPEQVPDKRQSKLPGEWWKASATPEKVEAEPRQLLNANHKTSKHGKNRKAKQSRPPKSARRAVGSLHSQTTENEKQMRSVVSKRTLPVDGGTAQSHEVVQVVSPDSATPDSQDGHGTFTVDGSQGSLDNLQDICPSRHVLESRPVTIIDLEPHEDEDLPSTRHSIAQLCISDLCAPPLKQCTVEFSDKADLIEWLQLVFPTTRKDLPICLDQFDWYYYKNGAMGITEDVHWWNLSQGKMLLGSFMKKPLWVDHNANMGCLLVAGSVKVKINSTESEVHAGSCFTVPCGQAYSIENLVERPAVICFSRVPADSPD
ncbi:uncharacterized protein LOC144021800 isoform X2 [Festucalex cinctus]